tara:strand:- start:600 stop:1010 length:411 start_codon:yes stop_codon:yes gene_type:complete
MSNIEDYTNEQLANAVHQLTEERNKVDAKIKTIKSVILKRMSDNNSHALPTSGYKVTRKITKYDYDIDTLYAQLGEILTPEELDKIFINVPSYQKIDGVQVRSIISQYGEDSDVAKIIYSNRGEMNPVLTVKKIDS